MDSKVKVTGQLKPVKVANVVIKTAEHKRVGWSGSSIDVYFKCIALKLAMIF